MKMKPHLLFLIRPAQSQSLSLNQPGYGDGGGGRVDPTPVWRPRAPPPLHPDAALRGGAARAGDDRGDRHHRAPLRRGHVCRTLSEDGHVRAGCLLVRP